MSKGSYSAFKGIENGSTDGAEFNGMIATGFDWRKGSWKFGPTASFEYSYVEFNSFSEKDDPALLFPLHFPDQHQDAERSNLGIKIAHQQNAKGEGVTVIPEVHAYWRHDYGNTSYPITANFVGCPDLFTVHGPAIGRDSALVDAGVTILCTKSLAAYLYYNGQFGRSNYFVDGVSGGFRVAF